jgi:membrane fusion protein, multidrug efflux system
VLVSSDLGGIVEKIHFESGASVREGDVLVTLNVRQERAQLTAAEAQRNLAQLSFERVRGLHEQGVVSQADFDESDAGRKQADARVGEIEATIERKTIRAPFSGTLGIRMVNLGQHLKDGDPVVPLQSLDPIYVNFSVPQQRVAALRLGEEVKVFVDDAAEPKAIGKITAVNSVVDEATRNVQVQASFRNPDGKLMPGMFVRAQVLLDAGTPVVALPASAINHAPYGDSVYIIGDLPGANGKTYRGVHQQFVKLGGARGDQVAVLSGVHEGEEVVTSGVFKLRNGAAIIVNNDVQPSNSPAPRPEDS